MRHCEMELTKRSPTAHKKNNSTETETTAREAVRSRNETMSCPTVGENFQKFGHFLQKGNPLRKKVASKLFTQQAQTSKPHDS